MQIKPIIAITMGDPCGIGPEIVVKSLYHKEIFEACQPLVIGNRAVLEYTAGFCGKHDFAERFGHIISDVSGSVAMPAQIGTICAAGGRMAYDCIRNAAHLCMNECAAAVATAPINKESLRAADVDYIGHTEIFAALTHTEDPLTMFETRGLRVFFLTRHVSLTEACRRVTRRRILDYIERCTAALHSIGVTEGTMAVAGLNPHSGEHGLFGTEEVEIIAPAVEEARRLGFAVTGPVSADSVFHQAYIGKYNAVLSLYHDQGHIATKTLDFERTIAITHGMPFLRTSVDHGTAFDIAGKNQASEISMVEAILLAAKYSARRTCGT